MKNFISDERGNSWMVIFGVMILMFIFVTTNSSVIMAYRQGVLEEVKMNALDQMQIVGCLNAQIDNDIRNKLISCGFENSNITITGTTIPVIRGQEVAIDISYKYSMDSYEYEGLINFTKKNEMVTMQAFGSTISYHYDNN